MLTMEAQEDREWCGFDILRRVLSQERRKFENGMYLTSISDAVVDKYSRYFVLGELVAKHGDTLAWRLAQEDDESTRRGEIDAAMNELDQLRCALESLAAQLEGLAHSVQSVQEQVYRSR